MDLTFTSIPFLALGYCVYSSPVDLLFKWMKFLFSKFWVWHVHTSSFLSFTIDLVTFTLFLFLYSSRAWTFSFLDKFTLYMFVIQWLPVHTYCLRECVEFFISFWSVIVFVAQVISKLTEGRASHIPYRDSKLTRLLQSSLSGHGRISVRLVYRFSEMRLHSFLY